MWHQRSINNQLAWKKSYDQPRQHVKKQRDYFANTGPTSQSYGSSSSHVWMWELDHKKAEHERIDAFQLWCWKRLLTVPWTARRANQSILKKTVLNINWKDWCWSWNSNTLATWWDEQTHWRRPWCWEDWRQEKKGMTEDAMVGWPHPLDGHGFEKTLGVGDGQGSLECCSLWGGKNSDKTEQLNWLSK